MALVPLAAFPTPVTIPFRPTRALMDPPTNPPGFLKRWLLKASLMALAAVAFGYLYAYAAPRAFPLLPIPGFRYGVLHGALMPMALPSLVLGRDVPIYSPINSGRLYKIGYIVGINLCGLVFFGPLFWRPARARDSLTKTSSQKSG
jgi:hypothetical protein